MYALQTEYKSSILPVSKHTVLSSWTSLLVITSDYNSVIGRVMTRISGVGQHGEDSFPLVKYTESA